MNYVVSVSNPTTPYIAGDPFADGQGDQFSVQKMNVYPPDNSDILTGRPTVFNPRSMSTRTTVRHGARKRLRLPDLNHVHSPYEKYRGYLRTREMQHPKNVLATPVPRTSRTTSSYIPTPELYHNTVPQVLRSNPPNLQHSSSSNDIVNSFRMNSELEQKSGMSPARQGTPDFTSSPPVIDIPRQTPSVHSNTNNLADRYDMNRQRRVPSVNTTLIAPQLTSHNNFPITSGALPSHPTSSPPAIDIPRSSPRTRVTPDFTGRFGRNKPAPSVNTTLVPSRSSPRSARIRHLPHSTPVHLAPITAAIERFTSSAKSHPGIISSTKNHSGITSSMKSHPSATGRSNRKHDMPPPARTRRRKIRRPDLPSLVPPEKPSKQEAPPVVDNTPKVEVIELNSDSEDEFADCDASANTYGCRFSRGVQIGTWKYDRDRNSKLRALNQASARWFEDRLELKFPENLPGEKRVCISYAMIQSVVLGFMTKSGFYAFTIQTTSQLSETWIHKHHDPNDDSSSAKQLMYIYLCFSDYARMDQSGLLKFLWSLSALKDKLTDKVNRSDAPPSKNCRHNYRTRLQTGSVRSRGTSRSTVFSEVDDRCKDPRLFVTYPPGSSKFTITHGDLVRLEPEIYLNDTLIDFYLKHLQLSPGFPSSVYMFNSFFYKRFISTQSKDERYGHVKNWTKKDDIFAKDYVIVPVNQHLHWSLVVICFLRNIGRPKRQWDEPTHAPCMIYLDSLKGGRQHVRDRIFSILREYLTAEFEHKANLHPKYRPFSEGAKKVFTKANLPGHCAKVPIQNNSHDCGVYLLHYAELFCGEPFQDTSSAKMCSRPDWFKSDVIREKRVVIKELLQEIKIKSEESATAATQSEIASAGIAPSPAHSHEPESSQSNHEIPSSSGQVGSSILSSQGESGQIESSSHSSNSSSGHSSNLESAGEYLSRPPRQFSSSSSDDTSQNSPKMRSSPVKDLPDSPGGASSSCSTGSESPPLAFGNHDPKLSNLGLVTIPESPHVTQPNSQRPSLSHVSRSPTLSPMYGGIEHLPPANQVKKLNGGRRRSPRTRSPKKRASKKRSPKKRSPSHDDGDWEPSSSSNARASPHSITNNTRSSMSPKKSKSPKRTSNRSFSRPKRTRTRSSSRPNRAASQIDADWRHSFSSIPSSNHQPVHNLRSRTVRPTVNHSGQPDVIDISDSSSPRTACSRSPVTRTPKNGGKVPARSRRKPNIQQKSRVDDQTGHNFRPPSAAAIAPIVTDDIGDQTVRDHSDRDQLMDVTSDGSPRDSDVQMEDGSPLLYANIEPDLAQDNIDNIDMENGSNPAKPVTGGLKDLQDNYGSETDSRSNSRTRYIF
eukprot:972851_1